MYKRTIGVTLLMGLTATASFALPAGFHPPRSTGGEVVTVKARGLTAEAKLSPDLQALYEMMRGARGPQRYSPAELEREFGIKKGDRNATVTVGIKVTDAFTTDNLTRYGGSLLYKVGMTNYANVPVAGLVSVAKDDAVISIASVTNKQLPPSPAKGRVKMLDGVHVGRGEQETTSFDHHGLTGKGVIVGVIDTGIDFKHGDFLKPDGTTRIIEIWDMMDDSWTTSNGTIGSAPPMKLKDKEIGTLYTRAQINDAIAGKITIPEVDEVGHGTACAGTAAGNGAATGNDVPAGTYTGVAPEADLIIVRAAKGESISSLSFLGTKFIADEAKRLGQPCVISQSFGSTSSSHDGGALEDLATNEIVPDDSTGLALCVAAGNEGQYSMHAGGRFGPVREGQADIDSDEIELFVKKQTVLSGYFAHEDQWGLCIAGLDKALTSADGKPALLYIERRDDGEPKFSTKNSPADMDAVQKMVDSSHYEISEDKKGDNIRITLPEGNYIVWG